MGRRSQSKAILNLDYVCTASDETNEERQDPKRSILDWEVKVAQIDMVPEGVALRDSSSKRFPSGSCPKHTQHNQLWLP